MKASFEKNLMDFKSGKNVNMNLFEKQLRDLKSEQDIIKKLKKKYKKIEHES